MTATIEALTPRIVDRTAEYYNERRRIDLERIATLEREIADLRAHIEMLLEMKP